MEATATSLKPEVVFDDTVLAKIASNTAQEVEGVLSLQGNLIDDISNRALRIRIARRPAFQLIPMTMTRRLESN
ncbi:hypothetical protein ACT5GY_04300 [Lactiplantibacillus plantarum]